MCRAGLASSSKTSPQRAVPTIAAKIQNHPLAFEESFSQKDTRLSYRERGYAIATVDAGSGVIAYASVTDNITNHPTTIVMSRLAP